MKLERLKEIIREELVEFELTLPKMLKADAYYQNKNDILFKPYDDKHKPDNPLRNADNRISHPFHSLLVNQKASYTMSTPPSFEVDVEKKDDNAMKPEDRDKTNKRINTILGDKFPKVAKELAIQASNHGSTWLHTWIDDETGFFKYAVISATQIIPIRSPRLDDELIGLLRVYVDYNDQDEKVRVFEYWTKEEVVAYAHPVSDTLDHLSEYNCFHMREAGSDELVPTHRLDNEMNEIPFIEFRNNPHRQSDLDLYKGLIDVYDNVYAGFTNDLEDVQEIIFLLTNYGGEDKEQFLKDLQQYKIVKLDDDPEYKSGLDTLAIDIPVEARTKLLEITRDGIFTHGQGVDPQKNIGQNNSGTALQYMYSLLELKASMLETEFRIGFAKLVRFILDYENLDKDTKILQAWKRTSITSQAELADTISKLAPITSKIAIAKANPLVENWREELEDLAREELEMVNATTQYKSEEDYKPASKKLSTDNRITTKEQEAKKKAEG